jgi:hypothetical protein
MSQIDIKNNNNDTINQKNEIDNKNNEESHSKQNIELKLGEFMLTPLETLLINKLMPFGIKLDTEDNILKSIEQSKPVLKKHKVTSKYSEPSHKYTKKKSDLNSNKNSLNNSEYNNEYLDKNINQAKINACKKCEKALKKLKEQENAEFFYNNNINSNDTLTLTQIERNIKNYYYNNLYEFIMDLRKLWSYYFQNYSNNAEIYSKTCKMSEASEKIYKEFNLKPEDKTEMYENNISSINKRIQNLKDGIYDIKQAPKDRIINNKKQNSINNETPMTLDEKNALGNAIRGLNKDQLKGIIKLLTNSSYDQKQQNGQNKYFEFDIDKLPIKKLRELEQYVKDCSKQTNSNNIKKNDNNKNSNLSNNHNNIQKLKNDLQTKNNNQVINNDNNNNIHNTNINNNNEIDMEEDESSNSSDSDLE